MNPTSGRRRLALAIKDRRRELGLRQDELRDSGGPSPQTVLDYENEKMPDEPQARTLQGFDRALRWQIGTSQKLFLGKIEAPDTTAPPRTVRAAAQAVRRHDTGTDTYTWVPVPSHQVKDLAMQASKLAVWSRLHPMDESAQALVEGIHGIAADMLALAIGVEVGDTELVELISRLGAVTNQVSGIDREHNQPKQ